MPTACDQTFEHRSGRACRIEMERLRIELTSKLDDLLLRHFQRLRLKSIAYLEIVKVSLRHLDVHAALLMTQQRETFFVIFRT